MRITDTSLRDGHQSLMATRLRTEDILPVAERLDRAGFYSLEVWGGATFDVCIRFLGEDPWDRLRKLKDRVTRTPLQMLLRGQNLVGYRHYPDDVVEKFVRLAHQRGIGIFRIFDALNDLRNVEVPVKVAKDVGALVSGTICYTTSPVHTIPRFVEIGARLKRLGCDTICIKDMAGLITPQHAFDLVRALKAEVRLPIALHTHCTSGMGPLSYFAACNAGVDIIDTAFAPLAGGSSQPATEVMVGSLAGTPRDTKLDLARLIDIGYYFLQVREKYRRVLSPIAEKTDTSVMVHQIPGGMLSNLHSQLEEQKALDHYPDVLEETPRVRADLGYPPLVTPTSQIVGSQAVLNVLAGRRYERVTQEVKDYLLGLYGMPPGPVNEAVRTQIIGDQKPLTVRPADLLKPELRALKKEAVAAGLLRPRHQAEDLLTYALFPKVAPRFLRGEVHPEKLEPVSEGRPSNEEELKVAAVAAALTRYFKLKRSPLLPTRAGAVSAWRISGRREMLR